MIGVELEKISGSDRTSADVQQYFRDLAIDDLKSCIDDTFGLRAAGIKEGGFNNRYGSFFTRDMAVTAQETLPHIDLGLAKALIPAVIRAQDFAISHIGRSENPDTGERRNKLPHEAHTDNATQDRLVELEDEFPVITHPDGRKELVDYLADDVNSEFRNSVYVVFKAIHNYFGKEAACRYAQRMWPYVLITLDYDITNGDLDGDKLLESDPHKEKQPNPTFKDSLESYFDEQGRVLVGPRKYLHNNTVFIDSLRKTAQLATYLGHKDLARELRNLFAESRKRLHEQFWDPDFEYMAPVIDSENNRINFIGDDPVDGLWRGIFYPEYADKILLRLAQPDMDTPWGIRTRSSQSSQFPDNMPDYYNVGKPRAKNYYQNGSVWAQRTPQAAWGAYNYRKLDLARRFTGQAFKYRSVMGHKELAWVRKDNSGIENYLEHGRPSACDPQAWAAGATFMLLELSKKLE